MDSVTLLVAVVATGHRSVPICWHQTPVLEVWACILTVDADLPLAAPADLNHYCRRGMLAVAKEFRSRRFHAPTFFSETGIGVNVKHPFSKLSFSFPSPPVASPIPNHRAKQNPSNSKTNRIPG